MSTNNVRLPLAIAASLAAAMFFAPSIASANDNTPADRAAQILAAKGIVSVSEAGPNVELGSYRIQVWTMLGHPYKVLADGSYLYRKFTVDDSTACGTLVVRFDHGKVCQLSLVSPAIETALLTAPANAKVQDLLALK